jgi:hypothetical protein
LSARFTPYEAVFRDARHEADLFPAIRAEAAAQGRREAVPDEILLLQSAGNALRELPPDTSSDLLPPAAALREYGALLFQAFRFWSWGHRTIVIDEPLGRYLLNSAEPLGEWTFSPPHPAGYLQLPRHLLWASVDDEAVPEPIDGLFWSAGGTKDEPPWQRIDLLFVLGLRPDRPGFSVIEVSVPLPADAPGHWGDIRVRDSGSDFANVLPGGEMQGFHSMVSVAETLKLASRAFHYVMKHPEAVAAARLSGEESASESRSRIPASLVTLSAGG